MGGVNVDSGGHGGKKAVDSEIPLIPFIDLLLCCVMFLLVTAVWNKLARLDTEAQAPNPNAQVDPPDTPPIRLWVEIAETSLTFKGTDGTEVSMPNNGEEYDLETLRDTLRDRRAQDRNRTDLIVVPDDNVDYENIIATMDIALGEGFAHLSVSDRAPSQ
ncbi:MAG: ExbD/TolR family protein [Sandaracinaceae bacterium]